MTTTTVYIGVDKSRFTVFYVYWTVHHLDSWIKRDQLDVTCFIISLFTAQHVSDVNTSATCWALNNEIIKQVTSSWSLFIQLGLQLFVRKKTCRLRLLQQLYYLKRMSQWRSALRYNLVSTQIAGLQYLHIEYNNKLCVSRTHNCQPTFLPTPVCLWILLLPEDGLDGSRNM